MFDRCSNKSPSFVIPEILLPSAEIDFSKWSVIACDQYTSQPEYWKKVRELVGDSPSTLHLVFPEVYLNNPEEEKRIGNINKTMREYLDQGVVRSVGPGFVLIIRCTGRSRRTGVLMAVDLEQYDYRPGSRSLIRATEETVLERLPPRIKIRRGALLELPHTILFIDDPLKTVIEPAAAKADKLEKLYDFDLMLGGGHITGYKIGVEDAKDMLSALSRLAEGRSSETEEDTLLFAVGDGNHSLATAKACWEELKATLPEKERQNHPSRYALVEVVNIRDDGIVFEPIHRVVFGADPEELLTAMKDFFGEERVGIEKCPSREPAFSRAESLRSQGNIHAFPYKSPEGFGLVWVSRPSHVMEVGTLQAFLDRCTAQHPSVKVDYVHGADAVDLLVPGEGSIGFYLSPMDKSRLFKTVMKEGILPKKSFSIGSANEKRYYMELRRIK